jgi:hypothetical protein
MPLDHASKLQYHAAGILFAFREGLVTDWTSLVAHLRQDLGLEDGPDDPEAAGVLETAESVVLTVVERLFQAGLLVSDPPAWRVRGLSRSRGLARNRRIRVSERWTAMQGALELSLRELAEHPPSRSVYLSPLYGRPNQVSPTHGVKVFVIMPFAQEFDAVYAQLEAMVTEQQHWKIRRADSSIRTHAVMQDIWDQIYWADGIIADCTGQNPNVLYELGIAHTAGKKVMVISQHAEDVPFDVRYLRYFLYDAQNVAALAPLVLRVLSEMTEGSWEDDLDDMAVRAPEVHPKP